MMRKWRVVCGVCFVFLLQAAFSSAFPLRFQHLTTEEGLPQVTIRAIEKTADGFVWIATEDGLVRFDGSSVQVRKKDPFRMDTLSDNYVYALAEHPAGVLWVGTLGGGIHRIRLDGGDRVERFSALCDADIYSILPDGDSLLLGTERGLFRFFPENGSVSRCPVTKKGRVFGNAVVQVVAAADGIWCATRGQGLFRFRPETGAVFWLDRENGLPDTGFNTLYGGKNGTLWAGSETAGLVEILTSEKKIRFRNFTTDTGGLAANDVMAVADAGGGRLWVGTWEGGLQLFDPAYGVVSSWRHSAADPTSLGDDTPTVILPVDGDTLLVGTYGKGLSYCDPTPDFLSFPADPLRPVSLPDPMVWSFALDGDDGLWVGTRRGLARLDLQSCSFTKTRETKATAGMDIRSLSQDPAGLWIGTQKQGLFRLNATTKALRPVADWYGKPVPLTRQDVRVLLQDPANDCLWIGTGRGLNRLAIATGHVTHWLHDPEDPASLPHNRIRSLHLDQAGVLWVGTSNGFARQKADGTGFVIWRNDPASPATSLAGEGVQCVAEGADGQFYLATENGISFFHRKQGVTRNLSVRDGLSSDSVYSLILSKGFLWASTTRGLCRISPETFLVQNYFRRDGLPENEWNFNAWLPLPDGRMAFGGVNGFALVDPDLVPAPENSKAAPPLVVEVEGGERKGGERVLSWKEAAITFRYAALLYGEKENTRYRIRLKETETRWREEVSGKTTYVGLQPGRYLFEVAAEDRHGRWSATPESVAFVVPPPPWRTVPMLGFYGVLLSGTLAACVRWGRNHQKKRADHLEAMVQERSERLLESHMKLAAKHRELDRLMGYRNRLFRSIAHELRTPLSVIMAALYREPSASAPKSVALRSAERLSRLIGKILDVSRMDTHEKPSVFALSSAIEDAAFGFHLLAEDRNQLFFVASSALKDHWVCMDREFFITAVGNLFSNAVKYTPEGGTIEVTAKAEDGFAEIHVKDNGPGMAESQMEHLFEWFSRGEAAHGTEGWGIGLAAAKEVADGAGGSLTAINEAGMRFILRLPLSAPPEETAGFAAADSFVPDFSPLAAKTVLVVEDDPDLRGEIGALFAVAGMVLLAEDVAEGEARIATMPPDIVICDVMLPHESGLTFVARLREDPETAHIPVILLSACDAATLQNGGFFVSADVCMEKPFSPEGLLATAAALIRNREAAYDRARRLLLDLRPSPGEEGAASFAKEGFLARVKAAMEPLEGLAELTLDGVADRMGVSRRSFQREFEAHGITWSQFKRLQQIRYAMVLLRTTDQSVLDIAMASGFAAGSYFSRVFKETTGLSPAKWRRENR